MVLNLAGGGHIEESSCVLYDCYVLLLQLLGDCKMQEEKTA